MPLASIFTNDGVTVAFAGGILKTVRSDSALYAQVLKLIKEKATDAVLEGAMDLAAKITNHASGLFSVADGKVFIAGEELPKSLGDRIVRFANEGFDFQPLVLFWENCKLNPDPRAKTDLYAFLEHNGIPITSDGCFIGYRAIRHDWLDKHTKTMSNAVGNVVKMNRADCDSNPDQTCSRGLHVAAFNYARNHFGSFGLDQSDRLIDVKVNPKDVVAIPKDYNGEKMRVCEFTVVAENTAGVAVTRSLYDPPVDAGSDDAGDDGEDDESDAVVIAGGTDNWKSQTRLSNGRFGPKKV